MAAYFVAEITSHDSAWLAEYGEMVPPMVRKHGGELICRSQQFRRYEGDRPAPDYVIILQFPSLAAIDAFMSDPAYQPFKKARIACTDSQVFAIR
ncbi:DUF1330 domain-containing protein [Tsuneonella sp. HG094]